jgi:flagellar biosynthesis protein FliR
MNEALPLAAFGVLLVRPGTLIVATPIFGGAFVPTTIRVALTGILALVLFPTVHLPELNTTAAIVSAVAAETVTGLALALAVRVLVAGAEFAGYIAGFQIGLSYAAMVDPQTGTRSNVVAMLYSSLATVAFLATNGHHALLRALVRSYDMLPVGAWAIGTPTAVAVTKLLGLLFLIGTQLSMPIVIVLLLVEVGLGLASRAAPALNLMTLGFPVRIAAGLLALAVGVQVVPGAVVRYAPSVLETASRLVAVHR